ncbi:carbohydrate porin [Sorangium sp. So ce131]|uniref:carbohydrate porin n=1 Tax=Sorangium sp. So ce131 TaxID=3133282 RepID=UPI003F5E6337
MNPLINPCCHPAYDARRGPRCASGSIDGSAAASSTRLAGRKGWASARHLVCALLGAALCVAPAAASGQPLTPSPGQAPEGTQAAAEAPAAGEAAKDAAPPAEAGGAGYEGAATAAATPAQEPLTKEEPTTPVPPTVPESGFFFGGVGRAVAAMDADGGPGRDADIVLRGSRLDESTYIQMDLERQDYWESTGATTRVAIRLVVDAPILHYNNARPWNINMSVRNAFVEERDLGLKGLSVWMGSRLYRGDNSELLDFWPLDWLNTLGGGVRYDLPSKRTFFAVHAGVNRPLTPYYLQTVERTPALNQPGTANVNILDRQRLISSFKASHTVPVGEKGGVKGVLYGELHQLPSGRRETAEAGVYEDLPRDSGYVIGAQVSPFTGVNNGHLHLFLRYAGGLAAYGEFGSPFQPAPDGTASGAHELMVTMSANYETGPLGLMASGYVRSFRNASETFDFSDLDEGILVVRPHFYLRDWGGIAVEGSYQAQRRGRVPPPADPAAPAAAAGAGHHSASVVRFGLVPFLNVAGKGDFKRPQLRLIWLMTRRDEGAKALYAQDDVFSQRSWEHFIGMNVEWNFKGSPAF